jgi:hypothetical protein
LERFSKKSIEIVTTKSLRVDDVGPQDFIHPGAVNAGILLQPGKIDARRIAATEPDRDWYNEDG